MKTATVIVKLTKDHHVVKHGVTPIQALLLAAAHNIPSKGDPLEVVAGTEKDLDKRSEDDELARLRGIYPSPIVNLLKDIRELPKDFPDAITKGKGLTMPGGLASQPKASVIASATLK